MQNTLFDESEGEAGDHDNDNDDDEAGSAIIKEVARNKAHRDFNNMVESIKNTLSHKVSGSQFAQPNQE